jgi:predicted RNA-binding Zn-ribbon protein involved in translation (DUF1610 family)
MIRITCSSCNKPLSLDETKLPMKEVAFPCPVCKARLTIDRRTVATDGQADAAPALSGMAPPAPEPGHDDYAAEVGAKALVVGEDSTAIRQVAKLIGFLPIVHADPAKARDFFTQELPEVVFLHPGQLSPPPLEAMAPIIAVLPADRRKSFFILVAENLRTLDGNAAFLYGVNLVVATKDLDHFPQIYREAHTAHERLYGGMNAAQRERQMER